MFSLGGLSPLYEMRTSVIGKIRMRRPEILTRHRIRQDSRSGIGGPGPALRHRNV